MAYTTTDIRNICLLATGATARLLLRRVCCI
jgi:hypothetical protein